MKPPLAFPGIARDMGARWLVSGALCGMRATAGRDRPGCAGRLSYATISWRVAARAPIWTRLRAYAAKGGLVLGMQRRSARRDFCPAC